MLSNCANNTCWVCSRFVLLTYLTWVLSCVVFFSYTLISHSVCVIGTHFQVLLTQLLLVHHITFVLLILTPPNKPPIVLCDPPFTLLHAAQLVIARIVWYLIELATSYEIGQVWAIRYSRGWLCEGDGIQWIRPPSLTSPETLDLLLSHVSNRIGSWMPRVICGLPETFEFHLLRPLRRATKIVIYGSRSLHHFFLLSHSFPLYTYILLTTFIH